MAITAVSTYSEIPPPRRFRLFEDERWLALALLIPTIVLLGLFIAYPFVRGVWLSLTDATVGEAGHFIGLRNFQRIFDDSIFRTAALNTFVYTGRVGPNVFRVFDPTTGRSSNPVTVVVG